MKKTVCILLTLCLLLPLTVWAEGETPVRRVSVTVTPPSAGGRTTQAPPQVEVEGEGIVLAYNEWLWGPDMYVSVGPDYEFQEGETYYIYLLIRAEAGYAFPKEGTPTSGIDEGFITFDGCEAAGAEVIFAASRVLNDGDYLRVKLAVTAGPAGETPPVLRGDVDGSGKVDSTDARLTLQLAVGKLRETDLANPSAADADGSGKTDSTDARLILQYAVGKLKDWP